MMTTPARLGMPYLPFKRPSRIAIRPRQSIRHDPPTTGVEKKSLWSSSFHCTRAFLAVNEKRGRSEGLGPPTSAKALVRRLCVERLAQSSAVARLQSARTKHNSRSELSLFLKRSLDLFQASH